MPQRPNCSYGEYNPFECVKTNINGATNLIDACIDRKVKIVALSTDKASSPSNLYGATKLVSDKVLSQLIRTQENMILNFRSSDMETSWDHAAPSFHFKSLKSGSCVPITHPDMTRFMITLQRAVDRIICTK